MVVENTKQSKNRSVRANGLHKPSGSAVPGGKDYNVPLDPNEDNIWYVAILEHQKYTAYCCDYIEKAFTEQHCRCFVPFKDELHVYPNRTKRMVRKYIIPRLVFVTGIDERQAYDFVPQWPHVDLFMPDRARKRNGGRMALAKIEQHELVKLQHVINGIPSAEDVTFTTDDLHFDDTIEIVRGDLKGLEGGYCCDDGKDFLVVMIGKLGNIKVRVSIADCSLKKNQQGDAQ